jgi:hypothetical protein
MKRTKLVAPKTLTTRNGGNGGYSKKKPVPDEKMVRRKFNLRDYHGNLKQR